MWLRKLIVDTESLIKCYSLIDKTIVIENFTQVQNLCLYTHVVYLTQNSNIVKVYGGYLSITCGWPWNQKNSSNCHKEAVTYQQSRTVYVNSCLLDAMSSMKSFVSVTEKNQRKLIAKHVVIGPWGSVHQNSWTRKLSVKCKLRESFLKFPKKSPILWASLKWKWKLIYPTAYEVHDI